MEKFTTGSNTNSNTNTTATAAATPAATAPVTPAATATVTPAAPVAAPTAEEVCGSVNILDTRHLKNLVDDLSKLYSTSVCTKVARDTKVSAEKRLIEAIRANLDRYEG